MSSQYDYLIVSYPKECFKHIECRGFPKCLGIVTVYWNRFVEWLCVI